MPLPAGSMPCPFSAAARALHALFEELLYVHVIACLFGERTPSETRLFADSGDCCVRELASHVIVSV